MSILKIARAAAFGGFVFVAGCTGATDGDAAGENEGQPEAKEEVTPQEIYFDTDRILLHEVYSGSNCGPCKGADELIQGIMDNNPDEYTAIHYQVGSDPYMSFESVARYCYYITGSPSCGYSIPYLHVDGVNGFHPVQVNNDVGYTQEDFDRFQSEPCHMRLEVTHEVTDQTVDIEVTITAGDDYDSEDMVLQAAIIENTTHNNIGINEQTEFHHVMKKMVPDHNGTPLEPMVAGDVVTLNLSYTFNGEYNGETTRNDQVNHAVEHTVEQFDDLSVVVFVQDNETQMVHQSAWDAY
ncbi:MAG: hypothetical protein CMH56_01835 [Myxococcales bacterium]|nr:hypothetical protein [Myxococcales bacterium]|tara:strand:+ start:719 stop:1606 length:888 start_codon:yes stop_codon:yes gene_type:complete